MKRKYLKTSVTLKIPFHDNDPMGIVWHGNYYKYFEHSRDALLERLGFSILTLDKAGIGIPVIESSCQYRHAVKFLDDIRVDAHLSEWENRLGFRFEIFELRSGRLAATGTTVHVAYDMRKHELLYEIPKELREAINKAVLLEEQALTER